MRLTLNKDIGFLIKNGNTVNNQYFIVFFSRNSFSCPRLGISVKKKFGNACERNRIKRFLREFFRINRGKFFNGYDYLIMPRKKLSLEFKGKRLNDISQYLDEIVKKIREFSCGIDDRGY